MGSNKEKKKAFQPGKAKEISYALSSLRHNKEVKRL